MWFLVGLQSGTLQGGEKVELDKSDPEIYRIWAAEARKRWDAYRRGALEAVPYEKVMAKYRPR